MRYLCLMAAIGYALAGCQNDGASPPAPVFNLEQALRDSVPGQVIHIPAGTYRLHGEIKLDHAVEIAGAGQEAVFIETDVSDFDQDGLEFTLGSAGGEISIHDVTFRASVPGGHGNFIGLYGAAGRFHIHDTTFTDGGAHSLMVDGNLNGLIENTAFYNDSQESISLRNSLQQDALWDTLHPATPAAESEAVVIAHCQFDFLTRGTHAVTGVNGASFIFRDNIVRSAIDGALIDAHGNFENDRSNYSAEIYRNQLINLNASRYIGYAIYIRGGTALISDNQISGHFANPITLANYRSWKSDPRHPAAGSVLVNGQTYYPNVLSYSEARRYDSVRDPHLQGNSYNGQALGATVLERGLEREHIQLGRDYFEH